METSLEEKAKKEQQYKCPKCKVWMKKVISPNNKFIVDECSKCGGRFLDKEEIQNIKSMSFWQYLKLWFDK